jgi:hypothetical protein
MEAGSMLLVQLGHEAVGLPEIVGASLCDEPAIAQKPLRDGVGPEHLDVRLGHAQVAHHHLLLLFRLRRQQAL